VRDALEALASLRRSVGFRDRDPESLKVVVGIGSIVRRNMPFFQHDQCAYGTYFIGYAADPGITEQMLRNMFLGTEDAPHDRILDFSTATTGGLFFVPPASFPAGLPQSAHAGREWLHSPLGTFGSTPESSTGQAPRAGPRAGRRCGAGCQPTWVRSYLASDRSPRYSTQTVLAHG
jgi:hypothetical protein